jgi:hypothetical protein
MKEYGKMAVQLHIYLRREIEVSGALHCPAFLLPGNKLPVPIKQEAGWVRVSMYTLEICE